MEVCADLAPPFRRKGAKHSNRGRYTGYRVINNIGWHYTVCVKDVLGKGLEANIGNRVASRVKRRVPIKFLFCIDNDNQCRWPGRRR